jgi:hypothetical protein
VSQNTKTRKFPTTSLGLEAAERYKGPWHRKNCNRDIPHPHYEAPPTKFRATLVHCKDLIKPFDKSHHFGGLHCRGCSYTKTTSRVFIVNMYLLVIVSRDVSLYGGNRFRSHHGGHGAVGHGGCCTVKKVEPLTLHKLVHMHCNHTQATKEAATLATNTFVLTKLQFASLQENLKPASAC